MCTASREERIAPNSAVPNEPPICRKNVTELVATPMSLRSTEFCTTVISTCMVKPRPAPRTYIDRPANQYGELEVSCDSITSATITMEAPRIGKIL